MLISRGRGRIGASPLLRRYSGKYYYAGTGGLVANTGTPTAGQHYFFPHRFSDRISLSELGAYISTAAASANIQVGIYAADPITGAPVGPCLGKTGNIDASSVGPKAGVITGGPITLPAGDYYFDAQMSDAAVRWVALAIGDAFFAQSQGSATLAGIASATNTAQPCFSAPGTFGTMPDIRTLTLTQDTVFRGCRPIFRVA